jgi:hypothetical protein
MRCKRCGRAPHPVRHGAIGAGLIGLLAVLAGCANDRGAPHSSASATKPMHMAGVRVEIESDGLPAQLAPRNPTPAEDDPREPWSPNYGSVRPTRTSAIDTDSEQVSVAMPPPVQAIPVSYARPLDAEDIIRRAVAAHEMRQPH